MAVSQFPEYRLFVGLSTDTKPLHTTKTLLVKNGDKFLEMDTSKEYRYNKDGTAWVEQSPSSSVSATPNEALIEGNITLTGSAQQLTDVACKNITIQANPDNAGYVYVGRSASVSSSVHMAVLSGGSSMTFTINNANLVYVIGTASEKISFGGEV